MSFSDASYAKHREHYAAAHDESRLTQWDRGDTVDALRHRRMYDHLLPALRSHPQAEWLTVGDGRYGTDAHYLRSQGAKATASDIAETFLKVALEHGRIDSYAVENVEHMTFADNSFDFVLCKESYHHFPRPAVGLYEMLRVARKGVFLIEPNDPNIFLPAKATLSQGWQVMLRGVKNAMKKAMGKPVYYDYGMYETVGNYVYTVSAREMEKVALALNLPTVAFAYINDHYEAGMEDAPVDGKHPLHRKLLTRVAELDAQNRAGKTAPGLIIAAIFNEAPSPAFASAMQASGFEVVSLPRNPYA